MTTTLSPTATVSISGKDYRYVRRWSGQRLLPPDGYLAFDSETEVVDLKRYVPRLALASASAGEQDSCLIHPDDLGRFVLAHRGLHWICHHAAFDFWAVERHLRDRGEEQAQRAWWDIPNGNRLHDSMVLDMLVRLARDDSYPNPRDLAALARQYSGLEISKDNPYRMRYAEIIGKDWDTVEEGFFVYAVKDAIATRPTYLALRKQAQALAEAFGRHGGDILPGARQKFGLLTEAVQVKKAIALAQLTRNGMDVDLDWVRGAEAELRQELLQAVSDAHAECLKVTATAPNLGAVYKLDGDGHFTTSGKTDAPAFNDTALRELLTHIRSEIERESEFVLKIPNTQKGISRSVKIWADYAQLHPFLGNWIKAQGLAKLLQFFTLFRDRVDLTQLAVALGAEEEALAGALKQKRGEDGAGVVSAEGLVKLAPRRGRQLGKLGLTPEGVVAAVRALVEANRQLFCTVHPSYSIMVRTGRTSASSPNVQQIPKDSTFRQTFVASPGHFLLAVDYRFIELVTFAATAMQRYGWSKLGEVIKQGVDPHEYTAAMMLSVPHPEFQRWKDNEEVVGTETRRGKEVAVRLKDRYDRNRQIVKPVNFGVIGGLGPANLVAYAHSTYRVDLTLEEAKARREKLIHEIYPEMGIYLAEDGPAIVARNLQAPLWEVRNELGDTHLSSVRKILAGDPKRTDGKPYQRPFVSRVWASLAGLNKNPELREVLEKRQPSEALAAQVCHAGVATLTGRIRGRVRYSQARNTPFQGLAADGAALALFELVQEGFRVVGFVHDEILVELPDEGGYVSEALVRRVQEAMCRAMGRVLVGDIPVGCEAALSRRWSKKAKLIVRDGKVYPWEPPR
jgi:DNA polymerase I-like protein with 3'-5' exonuclease and polymerase domains